MKKKIITFVCIIAIVLFSLPFAPIKASNIYENTHYQLTINNNALIYTFPDYHGSGWNKTFLSVYDETNDNNIILSNRINNTLYINNDPLELDNCYNYIWAWYISIINSGVEDYEISLSVFNMLASDYYNGDFQLVGNYTFSYGSNQAIINIDYDSTLETFRDFSYNVKNLKAYLLYNGFQEGYSALGNLLEAYETRGYNSGYNLGYNRGVNENLANQNWWVDLWNGVDAFLNVELLPNLTFGLLFSVPLVFGVLHLILFIWRSGD